MFGPRGTIFQGVSRKTDIHVQLLSVTPIIGLDGLLGLIAAVQRLRAADAGGGDGPGRWAAVEGTARSRTRCAGDIAGSCCATSSTTPNAPALSAAETLDQMAADAEDNGLYEVTAVPQRTR